LVNFDLAFYLPFSFFFGLESYNSLVKNDNSTSIVCAFKDVTSQQIFCYLDLVNRTIIAFILMILFTSILIDYIFKSRKRVSNNYTSRENRNFQKDIKFAVSSVFLNLIYLIFTLPNTIDAFLPLFISFPTLFFLFYSTYAIDFYIIVMTNSLVRNEYGLKKTSSCFDYY